MMTPAAAAASVACWRGTVAEEPPPCDTAHPPVSTAVRTPSHPRLTGSDGLVRGFGVCYCYATRCCRFRIV